MDSKRLRVKKALTALLQQITPANGYQHDLSSKVWRGRAVVGDESERPCLVIVDVIPEEPVNADMANQKDDWVLGIRGYVKPDRLNPTDPAENLIADVKKALYPAMNDGGASQPGPDFLLGGLVGGIRVDSGVVFPPEEGGEAAYCVVKVTMEFIEKIEDPYNV